MCFLRPPCVSLSLHVSLFRLARNGKFPHQLQLLNHPVTPGMSEEQSSPFSEHRWHESAHYTDCDEVDAQDEVWGLLRENSRLIEQFIIIIIVIIVIVVIVIIIIIIIIQGWSSSLPPSLLPLDLSITLTNSYSRWVPHKSVDVNTFGESSSSIIISASPMMYTWEVDCCDKEKPLR